MGTGRLRRAIGAVKDKTSIGLAKVGSSNSISDLEIAIVKSTRHEEYPAEEKHVREIINLTCYSRAFVNLCVSMLARRLNKTRNWTVALKTLMLIHRLLCEGDPAYEQEIFFATRRGTRMLNMSGFRDSSRPDAWDFSAFVRTFALYLDESLELKMQGRVPLRDDGEEEEVGTGPHQPPSVQATPVHNMKIERIFTQAHNLQQLLERFLACRPTGAAKMNRVIIVALLPLIRESFQLYYDITEVLGILIDRFMELEIPDCVHVYEIFSRLSKQLDDLDAFYIWSNSTGIARTSEYPDIEKITPKKLQVMEEFIREKSILAEKLKDKNREAKKLVVGMVKDEKPEQDIMNIKALPPPDSFVEAPTEEQKEEKKIEAEKENEKERDKTTQEEGDLLNLQKAAITTQRHGWKLAPVLFDGEPHGPPPTWEAFTDEPADWETALVVSESILSNRRASLGGGLDILLLDGLYEHGRLAAATVSAPFSGSASSVAPNGGTQAGLLALPAPSASGSAQGDFRDPFAPSMAIAPPAYVQMSDMEKKQRLLEEEQLMWQQYAREGMQGQLGLGNLQSNPYGIGGFYR